MSWQAWATAVLVAFVVGLGGGWKLRADYDGAQAAKAQQAQRQADQIKREEKANAVVQASSDGTKVVTRIRTVVRRVPVYRSCDHDQRVLDDLNRQLRGDGVVPGGVPGEPGGAP